jgi:hypothetical protein
MLLPDRFLMSGSKVFYPPFPVGAGSPPLVYFVQSIHFIVLMLVPDLRLTCKVFIL